MTLHPAVGVGVLVGLVALSATAFAADGRDRVTDPVLSTSRPVFAVPPRSPVVHQVESSAGRSGAGPVDPAWVATTATRAGIPQPAVRAYADATLRIADEQPGCGLGWTTLAGIGYVESEHGTIGGRSVLADGHSDRTILGPALDGAGDVAAIRSTPQSTEWHGDENWDHAVGPLQFIPSTWAVWGSDSDRDGTADPNDLDDAAYAAARYLCASGPLDGRGWGAAILSYNHSEEYVRSVYDVASTYAAQTS